MVGDVKDAWHSTVSAVAHHPYVAADAAILTADAAVLTVMFLAPPTAPVGVTVIGATTTGTTGAVAGTRLAATAAGLGIGATITSAVSDYSSIWRANFAAAHPEVNMDTTIVHHAIEQKAFERWPVVLSQTEKEHLVEVQSVSAGK
jgi:hypothetical protein